MSIFLIRFKKRRWSRFPTKSPSPANKKKYLADFFRNYQFAPEVNYMKKIFLFPVVIMLLFACNSNSEPAANNIDYRQEMRNFVQSVSIYAKSLQPDFVIIPQNGHQLLTLNGEANGNLATNYLAAIDGVGREDLFYGYENDNSPTSTNETAEMLPFMTLAENNAKKVMVTDYCSTHSYMDDSYQKSFENNFISFAADRRELDDVPDYPSPPFQADASDIDSLLQAKNFLYLINPQSFSDKNEYLDALQNTDYDILLIDLFFSDETLSLTEVNSLKIKSNGGKRLVIAYMSIGEAENYRYYWQPEWNQNPPSWLLSENPNWEGNYKVHYWDADWQQIICGNDSSYLKKILDAGFDGVYLDLIDAFEYFEE